MDFLEFMRQSALQIRKRIFCASDVPCNSCATLTSIANAMEAYVAYWDAQIQDGFEYSPKYDAELHVLMSGISGGH